MEKKRLTNRQTKGNQKRKLKKGKIKKDSESFSICSEGDSKTSLANRKVAQINEERIETFRASVPFLF